VSPDWPIETERLLLRPFAEDDFGFLHDLYGDELVARWLYQGPESEAEVRVRLEKNLPRIALTEETGVGAVVALHDGTPVGTVNLWYTSFEHRGAELGYSFLPRHQGNGYAVEAARALLDWAFTVADVHRVEARLEPRNAASARVAEKLGMRREALFLDNEWVKGEWSSEAVYAILDREWPR
jgi:RimJ/RimL family protein N-acetyltransferase